MGRRGSAAARRTGSGPADELRKLLIADQRIHTGPKSRWHRPGVPDESLAALESGEPVIVSSQEVFSALYRAGLPHDDWVFGGQYFGHGGVDERYFLLGADGSITEEVAELDPDEPHCKGVYPAGHPRAGEPRTCFRCQPDGHGTPILPRAQVR
jgi:hypothetical protein